MNKGAKISECGRFRYQLWRIWDETKPKVLFIMLNPSTADAEKDDPTVRRLIGFTQRWGMGGFYVGNLFPFRTSSPAELTNWGNNAEECETWNQHLLNKREVIEMAKNIVFCVAAWGAHFIQFNSNAPARYRQVVGDKPIYSLGVTKDGCPRHPLYLPYESRLLNWPGGQPIDMNLFNKNYLI